MHHSSQVSHIFDGMSMIHSNRIHHVDNKTSGEISRRLVQTKCLRKNLDEKRFAVMGAWDYPSEWGMFDRLAALFADGVADNPNVAFIKLFGHNYATTESPKIFEFDPVTLETLGKTLFLNNIHEHK